MLWGNRAEEKKLAFYLVEGGHVKACLGVAMLSCDREVSDPIAAGPLEEPTQVEVPRGQPLPCSRPEHQLRNLQVYRGSHSVAGPLAQHVACRRVLPVPGPQQPLSRMRDDCRPRL
eukprot:scaffold8466_cov36-Prasinocladus_malaysianus.AAC.1